MTKMFTSSSQETRAVHSTACDIIGVEQQRWHEDEEYNGQSRVAPQEAMKKLQRCCSHIHDVFKSLSYTIHIHQKQTCVVTVLRLSDVSRKTISFAVELFWTTSLSSPRWSRSTLDHHSGIVPARIFKGGGVVELWNLAFIFDSSCFSSAMYFQKRTWKHIPLGLRQYHGLYWDL